MGKPRDFDWAIFNSYATKTISTYCIFSKGRSGISWTESPKQQTPLLRRGQSGKTSASLNLCGKELDLGYDPLVN